MGRAEQCHLVSEQEHGTLQRVFTQPCTAAAVSQTACYTAGLKIGFFEGPCQDKKRGVSDVKAGGWGGGGEAWCRVQLGALRCRGEKKGVPGWGWGEAQYKTITAKLPTQEHFFIANFLLF